MLAFICAGAMIGLFCWARGRFAAHLTPGWRANPQKVEALRDTVEVIYVVLIAIWSVGQAIVMVSGSRLKTLLGRNVVRGVVSLVTVLPAALLAWRAGWAGGFLLTFVLFVLATGAMVLADFSGELDRRHDPEKRLSELVDTLNGKFRMHLTAPDRIFFHQLVQSMLEDDKVWRDATLFDFAQFSAYARKRVTTNLLQRSHANVDLVQEFADNEEFRKLVEKAVLAEVHDRVEGLPG